MAKIVSLFGGPAADRSTAQGDAAAALAGCSIEVTPRTVSAVEDMKSLLPDGAQVYVAHIAGTPIEDMRTTVGRLAQDGFDVVPHIPARLVADAGELDAWLSAYADLGASAALALAGGVSKPTGDFSDSMALLSTGLFDKHGFRRLKVAGHPEGNRDIDPDGSERAVMAAARWKRDFAERTGADVAMVTQFVFDAAPVFDWTDRLAAEGIDLPVHMGVAGPAKLQTLIKFAIACGVGPSLRVLQRRAMDMTKLLLPFEPTEVLRDMAALKAQGRGHAIAGVHLFPLGGVKAAAAYARSLSDASVEAARRA